jgi:hypothetical protein
MAYIDELLIYGGGGISGTAFLDEEYMSNNVASVNGGGMVTSFSMYDGSAAMEFKIRGDRLNAFIQFATGIDYSPPYDTTYNPRGKLFRRAPARHPTYPWLRCIGVESVQGERHKNQADDVTRDSIWSPDGKDFKYRISGAAALEGGTILDATGLFEEEYHFFNVRLNFGVLPWGDTRQDLIFNSGGTFPGGTGLSEVGVAESQRYVSWDQKPKPKYAQVIGTQWAMFDGSSADPKNFASNGQIQPIPVTVRKLRWHRVPLDHLSPLDSPFSTYPTDYTIPRLDKNVGKLNSYPFLGFDAFTLKFNGATIVRQYPSTFGVDSGADYPYDTHQLVDIELEFEHTEPPMGVTFAAEAFGSSPPTPPGGLPNALYRYVYSDWFPDGTANTTTNVGMLGGKGWLAAPLQIVGGPNAKFYPSRRWKSGDPTPDPTTDNWLYEVCDFNFFFFRHDHPASVTG